MLKLKNRLPHPPFQKSLHHIACQPQFFCLRTNVHHQFIPGFAVVAFKAFDPEAEIGIGFVDDADALVGNLRPEQGQSLTPPFFYNLPSTTIFRNSPEEITGTLGKGILLSTLKCASSVTIKLALPAMAQSTNLSSSGS